MRRLASRLRLSAVTKKALLAAKPMVVWGGRRAQRGNLFALKTIRRPAVPSCCLLLQFEPTVYMGRARERYNGTLGAGANECSVFRCTMYNFTLSLWLCWLWLRSALFSAAAAAALVTQVL